MQSTRRLGLIVPSSNTVAERDFLRLMPAEVAVHTARMHLARTTAAAERVMLDKHAPAAADDLGTLNPDVLVFSCTSAGGLLGVDGEADLEGDLGERSGAPVVSTNAAVARRLGALGVSTVAVATAYTDELNEGIRTTLVQRGFTVPVIKGMEITDNFSIAMVPPDDIVDFCVRLAGSVTADALFVSCTNLRSVEVVERLTARLGIPVVTSNLAAAESALAMLGLPGIGIGVP